MNPYTTASQARIQQRDIEVILGEYPFLAATQLAALERRRGYQAEAELDRLLKQYSVTQATVTSRIAMVRQAIGAAMIRAGERLAGTPRPGVAPETDSVAGMLRTPG